MQKITIAIMAIGACASLPSCPVLAQGQDYALFPLQVLNEQERSSATYAISASGCLVGSSVFDSVNVHAVMWPASGGVIDLGTLSGDNSEANGVNDSLEIVGWSGKTFGPRRAFLYRDGQMIDLGTLGGEVSAANDINDLGQVVGQAHTKANSVAFLWENGEMRALPTLEEGQTAQAYAINNAGRIVGYSNSIAVYWEGNEIFELPRWTAYSSDAFAVNDLGVVVGQAHPSAGKVHGAAWIDGRIYDLHRAGLGPNSSAWGINNVGQIVGYVGDSVVTTSQAFLWKQDGGMRTLNSMVPPRLRKNWSITMAHGINDAGQIAAYGKEAGRPLTLVPFLISPVGLTMEMTAPTPGAAGTSNTITVSSVTPGATVTFLYSRHGGGTRIPGCDLQQNALQLDQPTVIGSAIADANGVATITRPVPLIARGQTILFQAVVQNECTISQLVVHEFQ